jgi:protein-S-isoprenylcysteine O-methyltransferase Ste14
MSALFPSRAEAVVFWFVVVGGLAWMILVIWRAGGSMQPDAKKDRSEPFVLAVGLLFAFTLVIPIVIGYARIGVLPRYLFYPGLAIWIVGLATYGWGVLVLGHFHSGFVRVVSGHRLIEKGPYRFVRHPLYASEILAWIGLGLALQSWVALLIIVMTSAIFYRNRIRIEERFLAAEIGDEYVQYMKRVKRIVPFIL